MIKIFGSKKQNNNNEIYFQSMNKILENMAFCNFAVVHFFHSLAFSLITLTFHF
jgi:hypothetical protein